jgi:pimeloyl-ACP methyl ester carboxylesterase
LAAALLKHLGINHAVVIGTSGGGMPAASFARHFPQHTAALILQCAESHQWNAGKWLPNGIGPALFLFRHRIFTPLLRWKNMRQAKLNHRQPISCIRQMSGSRFVEIRDDSNAISQITELTRMTLDCASMPAGIQNDWAIMVNENGITNGSINCPTLIIHDQADPVVPFIHAEWSHSCIPESRLLTVNAGGHLIWFGKDFQTMHTERVAFIHSAFAAKLEVN